MIYLSSFISLIGRGAINVSEIVSVRSTPRCEYKNPSCEFPTSHLYYTPLPTLLSIILQNYLLLPFDLRSITS